MKLRDIEALIAKQNPEFDDQHVAAAMLCFVDNYPPGTYRTDDGVSHPNTERLSSRDLANDVTLAYFTELEQRAQGLRITLTRKLQ